MQEDNTNKNDKFRNNVRLNRDKSIIVKDKTCSGYKNDIIFISLIVIVCFLIFISGATEAMQFLKAEDIKSKVKIIMKDLDYNDISFVNPKTLYSDNIIDKLTITANNDTFDVYIYNKTDVYNIVNNKNNKEIYSNKKLFLKNDENEDVIILIKGLFGAYGKINIYDGNAKLKYFLPKGKYKFRRLKLDNLKSESHPSIYIQKNTPNNGIITETNIQEIKFSDNLFIEVDISDNVYIDLSDNSIFEVQKILDKKE